MTGLKVGDAAARSAADVIHTRNDALPGSATVADVRDWFAGSSHRRMAVLADEGQFVGWLTADDLADADADAPAAPLARREPTVAPDAPLDEASRLALVDGMRRVPVVDEAGRLLGVVAVTEDLSAFCGVRSGSDRRG
ncbi:MAG TPA: CBS domain-containing protein [Mycobacteriales bacterium]